MPTPYLPPGQVERDVCAEKGVWDLHQDPAPSPAWDRRPRRRGGQALQQLKTLADDAVALLVLDIADKTDAAGVVLVAGS